VPGWPELRDAPVEDVARRLLGAHLTHAGVTVRITEVEAYDGSGDPASHAYRGRTPRTATMFGPAGRLYVYRSYGLHWCANVVCGEEGRAAAVLLRAGRVVAGLAAARERRGPRPADHHLARGPACLTQALGFDGGHDGLPLAGLLDLDGAQRPDPAAVSAGPRVGVSQEADRPWRFWLTGESTVSTYRRSPRAAAP
jgi:DNA-3-methyladenine glycosylase